MKSTMSHTHSVLTAIFPGEPGLAGCPLNSPSFIPGINNNNNNNNRISIAPYGRNFRGAMEVH